MYHVEAFIWSHWVHVGSYPTPDDSRIDDDKQCYTDEGATEFRTIKS